MGPDQLLQRIVAGRTDLIWDYLAVGGAATSRDNGGVPVICWCAYYGDVSAIRFLLDQGESLASLGDNLDLNGAAFHGHWRLCEFLIERGADVNLPLAQTGETPLHSALCTPRRDRHDLVLEVLLTRGAQVDVATKVGAETGAFMRDCRTKAETPLHRAAAFGTERTIDMLLDAGADRQAKDAHGDTPLSWASWYARPDAILRRLLYGDISIHPDRVPMRVALLGKPGAAEEGQAESGA